MSFSSLYGNVVIGNPGSAGGIYGYSSFREENYDRCSSPTNNRQRHAEEPDGMVDGDTLDLYNMDDGAYGATNDATNTARDNQKQARSVPVDDRAAADVVASKREPEGEQPDMTAEDLGSAFDFFDIADGDAAASPTPAEPRTQAQQQQQQHQQQPTKPSAATEQREVGDNGKRGDKGSSFQGRQPLAASRAMPVAQAQPGKPFNACAPMMNYNYGYPRQQPPGSGMNSLQGSCGPQGMRGGFEHNYGPHNNNNNGAVPLVNSSSSSSSLQMSARPPSSNSRSLSNGRVIQAPPHRLGPYPGPFMMGPNVMPYGAYPPAPRAAAARERRLSSQQDRSMGMRPNGMPGMNNFSGPQGPRGMMRMAGPSGQGGGVQGAGAMKSVNGSMRSANSSMHGSMVGAPSSQNVSQYVYPHSSFQGPQEGNSFYNGGAGGDPRNPVASAYSNGAYGSMQRQGYGSGTESVNKPSVLSTASSTTSHKGVGGYPGMIPSSLSWQQQNPPQQLRMGAVGSQPRINMGAGSNDNMYSNKGDRGQDDGLSRTGIAARRQFKVATLSPIDLTASMDYTDN